MKEKELLVLSQFFDFNFFLRVSSVGRYHENFICLVDSDPSASQFDTYQLYAYITGQRTGTGLKNHHPRLVCSLDLYFVGLAYHDKNILCLDSL
jgi:hypothetical protein